MRRKKLALLSLAALLCLLLSGCFVKTVDELYTLPRHSDEYDNLQKAIDEVMAAAGCEYCAPVSGSNQQSVQLADLDGDGEEEAIVFAKTSDEKPLKAYVFDKLDGAYQNISVIEGNGAAFARVEYVDLDGNSHRPAAERPGFAVGERLLAGGWRNRPADDGKLQPVYNLRPRQ